MNPLEPNDFPRENSPNFSDEMADSAIPTENIEQWRDAVIHLSCGSCGEPVTRSSSTLRRRNPNLFSQESFVCKAGHSMTRVFRITWLDKNVVR